MHLSGFDRTCGVIMCALCGVHVGEVMFGLLVVSIDSVLHACCVCRFNSHVTIFPPFSGL